ncbi:bacillithiol system redox-active protein YtxJ [Fluviicola chungangensis]|uniref:Bacillithiol system redox-active protein YtxJ n=1 Tax=Fluviicola chungangensis TaxID=2597671 RepID=A0A556N363_9FLAO|nr:bacillithiol system redox-active protein YtxJ [Fluviicola chungangensis]TSJ46591.1 bacillithiol system redox-active protein YtxJ [Fluviicola chungangensis]
MGLFSNKQKTAFPWVKLTSSEQLQELLQSSETKPVLLFKHSTRCSISSMALNRFENQMDPEKATCVYLDLLVYRSLSNEIEALTGVQHQSPQAILISNHKVIYTETHNGISASDILKLI